MIQIGLLLTALVLMTVIHAFVAGSDVGDKDD
jgi:hypothetical protein